VNCDIVIPYKERDGTNMAEKGKVFNATVTKYYDSDFDSPIGTIELEIKSNKPILKETVKRGISNMFNEGFIWYNVKVVK